MAIYGDNKHNYKTEAKQRRREKAEFYTNRVKKAKENKNKLLLEVIWEMFENTGSDWEDYKKSLCIEALSKRTQKELKAILYGE